MEKQKIDLNNIRALNNLYEQAKRKRVKLSAFDAIVLTAVLAAILIALTMSTAFISSALFAGFGIVVGVAIVIHKFEYIRKIVVKYDKWIDASILIAGFALAGSVSGMATAAFASLLVSGYLIFARMAYQDDLTDFSLLSPVKKLFQRKKKNNIDNKAIVVVN